MRLLVLIIIFLSLKSEAQVLMLRGSVQEKVRISVRNGTEVISTNSSGSNLKVLKTKKSITVISP